MIKSTHIHPNDLLWLAGLLDGDGYFGMVKNNFKDKHVKATIDLKMVDEDTVQKVASIFNVSVTGFNVAPRINCQPIYEVKLRSYKATSLMALLYPYLSQRRQQKIDNILKTCPLERKGLKVSETIENLKEMRKTMTCKEIGQKYGVTGQTISLMTTGSYKNTTCYNFKCEDPPVNHTKSIHWLAGILEAEGSFMKGAPSAPNAPVVSIQMTDKDVMEHVATFFNKSLSSYTREGKTKDGKRGFKKIYISSLRGLRAVKLMEELYPLMSTRRQQQIKKAIESYDPNARAKANANKRAIPDSQLEAIYKKRLSGLTIRAIASQYDIDKNVILRALKRWEKMTEGTPSSSPLTYLNNDS